MNTPLIELPARRTRRRHLADFKLRIIEACQQPGVSIAPVAVANGLNPHMVRKWLIDAEATTRGEPSAQARLPDAPVTVEAHSQMVTGFIPVRTESSSTPATINVEINRGPASIKVAWPTSASTDCALWLRELLR